MAILTYEQPNSDSTALPYSIRVSSVTDVKLCEWAVHPDFIPVADVVKTTIIAMLQAVAGSVTLKVRLVDSPADAVGAGTLLGTVVRNATGSFTSTFSVSAALFSGVKFLRLVGQESGGNADFAALTLQLDAPFGSPCGPDFFTTDSLEQVGSNVLRLRYTSPPKSSSTTSTSSGTRPANYTVAGPVARTVTVASVVSDDDDVIDLYLDQDLVPGTWTVTAAAGIVSADSPPLQLVAPYIQGLDVTATLNQLPVGQGAENDDCEDALLKNFNPAYRNKEKWQGLMAGIAKGDCIVRDIAQKAFAQLFVTTASGDYLVRRAADRGVTRPEKTGISDDLFRKLVVTVTNNKLSAGAFLEMLEVFYGADAVRGYAETGTAAPYVLRDGATLQLLLDETLSVDVVFRRQDFSRLRRASAEEVAAVITRAIEARGGSGYALKVTDSETGDDRVRIYSGRRGLSSAVRITLGTAQPSLDFPTNLFPEPDPEPTWPHWTVTKQPYDILRFSPDSDSFINLSTVEPGDYAVILGVEFDAANRGTFEITNVYYAYSGSSVVQWFEVVNADGVAESGIGQCTGACVALYRRTRRTPYDNPSHVVVSQQNGQALVSIPATTRAVTREPGDAAYLQARSGLAVTAVARLTDGTTTVTTADAHGLSGGAEVWLDNVFQGVPATPVLGVGTPSGALSSGAATGTSADTLYTGGHRDTTIDRCLTLGLRDLDGDAVFIGGQTQNGSGVFATTYMMTGFQVTAVAYNAQQRHHAYRWTNADYSALIGGFAPGTESQCFRPIGRCADILTNAVVRNNVLIAGGYNLSPWQVFQTNNLTNKAFRAVKDTTRVGPSFWALNAAADTAARFTDAAMLSATTTKTLVTGGCTDHNVPSTAVVAYNQSANSWSSLTALKQARCQHQMVALPTAGEALVIGGRAPALLTPTPLTGFTFWNFDEAVASVTFAGPVTVNRNANPRPVGKVGWGAQLTSSMESTGGGAQTTLNSDLLGSWSLWGWMTSSQGTVLRNGITGVPGVEADNTLIAFGVDNTDEKFYVLWEQGAGSTVVTKKTAGTRPQLMPVFHDATYPRYYHFCITKLVVGANATFTLYINGVSAGQWTDTKPSGGNAGSWRFGQGEPGIFTGFSGDIDQVGFKASTVLTAAQVKEAYEAQVGAAYDSPKNIDAMPVGRVLSSCEVVNTTTGWVRNTGGMATARFGHGTAVLPDGRVIVAGGVGYNPTTTAVPGTSSQRQLELKSAEVYDPRTGHWSPLPDMLDAHSHGACVYVAAANKVYVWGGFSSTRVEYLDLRSMTWHPAPTSLQEVRARAGNGVLAGADTPLLMGGALAGSPIEQTTVGDYSLDPAADIVRAGGLNGQHRVLTAPSGTTLTLKTPEHAGPTVATTAVLTPVAAAAAIGAPGPFVYDPSTGLGITAIDAVLATRLDAGRSYPVITLQSSGALAFPDEPGYLVFGYGYGNQVGPVRYLGRLSSTDLALDAGFTFPATLPVGTVVTLVETRGPYVPDDVETIGAFYLTASPSGRVAAADLLTAVSAAGIELLVTVRYPGDRGLGGEGRPTENSYKLADVVSVFGSDDLDRELEDRRGV
jgi:hypothetical protein